MYRSNILQIIRKYHSLNVFIGVLEYIKPGLTLAAVANITWPTP